MAGGGRRGWVLAIVVCSVLLAETAGAQAPGEQLSSAVSGSVDGSTVRVFAVGTVGVETFEVQSGQVRVAAPRAGHGSGFVVGPGLVITAHHVIDGARHVLVRLPGDGGFFGARVVLSRKDTDVALLAFEAAMPALPIVVEAPPRVRKTVFAVGYPVDPARTQPQSARGIVAGFLDDGTIQLDMTLNPGNSGGPLVDEQERVVGMVVARGNLAAGVQGIGYAVQASKLAAILSEGKRRLERNLVPPLSQSARLGAVVVDELIQQGVLDELRKAGDLGRGIRSADLGKELDALTSRIHDADLLVFVAGALWNAALALEVAGVRQVGRTRLTDTEARALAEHLRTSSVETCRRQ